MNCMSVDRKSLLDSITGWFATLGEGLRNALALPVGDTKRECSQGKDRDFDGWVANDPMVTLDPASRYGDDATGFLAGSEVENPELGGKDD